MYDSDSSDSNDANARVLENVEWKRMVRSRTKDGYRDGLAKGEEETLQQGFDDGYSQNVPKFRQISYLKGILSALQSYHQLQDDKGLSVDEIQEIKTLLASVESLEKMYKEEQQSFKFTGTSDQLEPLTQNVDEVTESGQLSKLQEVPDSVQSKVTSHGKTIMQEGDGEVQSDIQQTKSTIVSPEGDGNADTEAVPIISNTLYADIYKRCCKLHEHVFGKELTMSMSQNMML